MRKVFSIFKRDLKRLLRNPVAIIVTLGVCIIPSLYAWFNIEANWDPYKNTSGMAVAVVNEDRGAQVEGMGTVNAGDMIVAELKKNTQLDWTFVDKSEGMEGVKEGKYYATFVIPSDFTSSLSDVLQGNVDKGHIAYYVNEKVNAVSPKVTDTGASTLESQINSTFLKTVANVVTDKLKVTASGILQDGSDASASALSDIQGAQELLAQLSQEISDASGSVSDARGTVGTTRTTLSDLSTKSASAGQGLSDSLDSLSGVRKKASDLYSQLSSGLTSGTSTLGSLSSQASSDLGTFSGRVSGASGTLDGDIASLKSYLAQTRGYSATLTHVRDSLLTLQLTDAESIQLRDQATSSIGTQITVLGGISQDLEQRLDQLQAMSDAAASDAQDVASLAQGLNGSVSTSIQSLNDVGSELSGSTMPKLSSALDSFSQVGYSLAGTTAGLSPLISQADGTLAQLDAALDKADGALAQTKSVVDQANGTLGDLATDVGAIRGAAAWQQLQSVSDVSTDKVSDFMSSPATLTERDVFSVSNYGSGVTPFYTNLALWVGGFVLVAIYKLEVDDEGVGDFKPWQGYLGRWLLLNALGQVQALICCVGDLALGIQCVSPALFVIAGLVESFVYVNIVYALSIAFKHIGKAIAVVLIIVQIPGSSGTYPIQMMPDFFQALYPWLPFTYGIDAMRETIGGFYDGYYALNILRLLVFVIPALLIGLGARRHLLNINSLFDKRLTQTDLMIGERVGMDEAHFKLTTIVKALMDSKDYKRIFQERTARFELMYPLLVRRGILSLFVVSGILLLMLFLLDAKMTFLVLWIVSLVAICTFLIVVEYFHYRVVEKTSLADMSREELYGMLDESLRGEFFAFAPIEKMVLDYRSEDGAAPSGPLGTLADLRAGRTHLKRTIALRKRARAAGEWHGADRLRRSHGVTRPNGSGPEEDDGKTVPMPRPNDGGDDASGTAGGETQTGDRDERDGE